MVVAAVGAGGIGALTGTATRSSITAASTMGIATGGVATTVAATDRPVIRAIARPAIVPQTIVRLPTRVMVGHPRVVHRLRLFPRAGEIVPAKGILAPCRPVTVQAELRASGQPRLRALDPSTNEYRGYQKAQTSNTAAKPNALSGSGGGR